MGRPWPLLSPLKPAGLQNLFSLGGALQPDRWGVLRRPSSTCQESKSYPPHWPSLHISAPTSQIGILSPVGATGNLEPEATVREFSQQVPVWESRRERENTGL